MIGYDQISHSDFRLYMNGAVVFLVFKNGVAPYILNVDTQASSGYAHKNSYYVERVYHPCMSTAELDKFPLSQILRGHTLFQDPNVIIHRFPTGYIRIRSKGDSYFLSRVHTEPMDRRAFKGFTRSFQQGEGILSANGAQLKGLDDKQQALFYTLCEAGRCDPAQTFWGIAEVLSIGTPDCMHLNFSREEAFARAKRHVKEFFAEDYDKKNAVCVPDFSVALIRIKEDEAVVLRHRSFAGYVEWDGKQVHYKGAPLVEKSDPAYPLVESAQKQFALALFADSVSWAH